MVAHPRKAVPGAVPGRKIKLPLSRLGEAYALAASGCSIEEIAEGLGVDRSTLLNRRRKSPEYQDTIARGRADFERGLRLGQARFSRQLVLRASAHTAKQAREEAAQLRAAALSAEALLAEVEVPHGPEAPPAAPQGQERQPAPEAEDEPVSPWPGGPLDIDPPDADEAMPLDDPLADWRD